MKLLNKVSFGLEKFCRYTITFLLMVVTVVLFIQVFARFVLNTGTFWTDELARFSMVWLIYLGVTIGIREKSLINVDVVESMFPKLKKFLYVFQLIIMLLYSLFILKVGWGTIGLVTAQRSPNMGVPMSVLYVVIPITAILMIVHLIVHLFAKTEQGEDT